MAGLVAAGGLVEEVLLEDGSLLKPSGIPRWASLSSEEIAKIATSVAHAEARTSGEIVVMIVRRSSAIGHLPLTVMGLYFTALFLFDLTHWQISWFEEEWWLWPTNIGIALGLALVLSRLSFFQRWLIPTADQTDQVLKRAQVEFYESSIHQTSETTGVLLFISLMEHQAVVFADKAIDAKIAANIWKEVVATLVKGAKERNLSGGIIEAVGMCGDLLSRFFPIKPNDRNELPNHLIIKE